MDYTNIDPRDRRIVIVASKERAKAMKGEVDWMQVAKGGLPLAGIPFLPVWYLYPFGVVASPFVMSMLVLLPLLKRKPLPYPVFEILEARDQFRFPMNHPIDGVAYACCDAEPDAYVPISAFHQYMYEYKIAAFNLLCGNLGVRRCLVQYAEEDGKDITGTIGATGIPTSVGKVSGKVNAGKHDSNVASAAVYCEFPEPKSRPIATQNGWMVGEPTWAMMEKLRLERDLKQYKAEFSYASDMGINAEVTTKIASIGINVGGKYEEMHRRKWVFEVEFW
jgi:hypothetical protein